MDYYKCEECKKIFDEFEMDYRQAQIDKKCLCKECREKINIILEGRDEMKEIPLRSDGQPVYAVDRLSLTIKKLRELNAELLEALKQVLKEYAPEGLPDQREEVTRAYQAIAKAEGR